MVKFAVAVIAVVVVLVTTVLAGSDRDWFVVPSYFYEILAFVALTTLVLYAFLNHLRNPGIFTQMYLLTLVVKLLGSGVFLLLVVLGDKAGAAENAVFFLIAYTVFTTLEISFLISRRG